MELRSKRQRAASDAGPLVAAKRGKRTTKAASQPGDPHSNTKDSMSLLSLPYDVRLSIYEYLLEPATDFESNLRTGTPTSRHLQFLLVCRTVYYEASIMAFRRATFIIDFRRRTRRTSLFTSQLVSALKADPDQALFLRTKPPVYKASAGPSPLERLRDAMLSLRPEHRNAIRSAALLLAADHRDRLQPVEMENLRTKSLAVEQSRALHAVVALLPALQRLAVPVAAGHQSAWLCQRRGPGPPQRHWWVGHQMPLTFSPFKHCYGAVLAPLPPPPPEPYHGLSFAIVQPYFGGQSPTAVSASGGAGGLRAPQRLPPTWVSFRDTVLGRSVESAVRPMRGIMQKQRGQQVQVKTQKKGRSKKKIVDGTCASAALVESGRDPRDHCWLLIRPDIEADACRAGRQLQTWSAVDGNGRTLSRHFDMRVSDFGALHCFLPGAPETRPWKFVEQSSGRSIELRIGWVDLDECPYSQKLPHSPEAADTRHSTAKQLEANANLAQFKTARAWKAEYE